MCYVLTGMSATGCCLSPDPHSQEIATSWSICLRFLVCSKLTELIVGVIVLNQALPLIKEKWTPRVYWKVMTSHNMLASSDQNYYIIVYLTLLVCIHVWPFVIRAGCCPSPSSLVTVTLSLPFSHHKWAVYVSLFIRIYVYIILIQFMLVTTTPMDTLLNMSMDVL